MSRLAKKPIAVPDKTEVTVEKDGTFKVVGPQGELSRRLRPEVGVSVTDDGIVLEQKTGSRFAQALWGTYASHVRNMIQGVNEPYVKKLIIEGVGYRAEVKGKALEMQLGFSHPVVLEIPEGLDVSVEKETVTVSGIDKELVGFFAAKIRAQRKPEPYKGKGIRYSNEVIRRKQGKKVV